MARAAQRPARVDPQPIAARVPRVKIDPIAATDRIEVTAATDRHALL